MATRSVVGRFLVLAILVVCVGVVAQAALIIMQGGKKPVKTAVAAPATAEVAAAATEAPVGEPVRVVYPGPLGDAPARRPKLADAAPASPLVAPQPTAKLAQAMAITAGAATPQAMAPAAPAAAAPSSQPDVPATAVAEAQPAPAIQPTAVVPSSPGPSASAPAASAPAATAPGAVEVASLGGGAPADDPAAAGGVNINTASVAALNHLGGGHIGESIAKHRPYRSVEDLVKKRILRRSVYDQIKHEIAAR